MIYVLEVENRALARDKGCGYGYPLDMVQKGGRWLDISGWIKVYWYLYVVAVVTGRRNKSSAVLAAVAAGRFYLDGCHPNIPMYSFWLIFRHYSQRPVSLTQILCFVLDMSEDET